ncbi:MAG: hypothetical protein DRN24_04805 [Thermoplasmata archaeon]|nr:MAG: hypothetical protein DRN24_04805 [Thermoplasmata archaeon]
MKHQKLILLFIFAIVNINSILAISQNEASNIAQEYANYVLIPQERDRLLEIYPPDSYEIEMGDAEVLTNKIEKIEKQSLWFVPIDINYKIIKRPCVNYELLSEGADVQKGNKRIIVYIDDVTASVVPELSKISSKDVFGCSDKTSERCDGVFITFDIESITEYYWVHSSVLKEICVCQESDKRECRGKPIDLSAYKYKPKPAINWDEAKENILNSCEGFSSVRSIELEEDEGDYFRFQVWPTQWRDAAPEWLRRGLFRTGDYITLKFQKTTGKILEQIKTINLSRYENILITQHNAEKKGNFWYIPPSELRNIVKYEWIVGVSPNKVAQPAVYTADFWIRDKPLITYPCTEEFLKNYAIENYNFNSTTTQVIDKGETKISSIVLSYKLFYVKLTDGTNEMTLWADCDSFRVFDHEPTTGEIGLSSIYDKSMDNPLMNVEFSVLFPSWEYVMTSRAASFEEFIIKDEEHILKITSHIVPGGVLLYKASCGEVGIEKVGVKPVVRLNSPIVSERDKDFEVNVSLYNFGVLEGNGGIHIQIIGGDIVGFERGTTDLPINDIDEDGCPDVWEVNISSLKRGEVFSTILKIKPDSNSSQVIIRYRGWLMPPRWTCDRHWHRVISRDPSDYRPLITIWIECESKGKCFEANYCNEINTTYTERCTGETIRASWMLCLPFHEKIVNISTYTEYPREEPPLEHRKRSMLLCNKDWYKSKLEQFFGENQSSNIIVSAERCSYDYIGETSCDCNYNCLSLLEADSYYTIQKDAYFAFINPVNTKVSLDDFVLMGEKGKYSRAVELLEIHAGSYSIFMNDLGYVHVEVDDYTIDQDMLVSGLEDILQSLGVQIPENVTFVKSIPISGYIERKMEEQSYDICDQETIKLYLQLKYGWDIKDIKMKTIEKIELYNKDFLHVEISKPEELTLYWDCQDNRLYNRRPTKDEMQLRQKQQYNPLLYIGIVAFMIIFVVVLWKIKNSSK